MRAANWVMSSRPQIAVRIVEAVEGLYAYLEDYYR